MPKGAQIRNSIIECDGQTKIWTFFDIKIHKESYYVLRHTRQVTSEHEWHAAFVPERAII